jgi:hypothetical protein
MVLVHGLWFIVNGRLKDGVVKKKLMVCIASLAVERVFCKIKLLP